MHAHRLSLFLVVLLCSTSATAALATERNPALTAEDKKLLDSLMKEFLFDPKGADRVTLPVVVRTVWASANEAEVDGWFVSGKDGKPGRVYFTDGAFIPAPPDQKMKRIDFVAVCQARYSPPLKQQDDSKKDAKEDTGRDETFRRMRRTAVGELRDDDLAMAVWLYRLGHEGLAARALVAARKEEGDPRSRMREDLAWSAFAGLIHAYMVRADEEALAHGERLLRLYANEVKSKEEYSQTEQLVVELKRRQQKGTFGKVPPETWPDGFDAWDTKKKTVNLIVALEEVDARQWGQPGGVDLASDRRVEALIQLGDPAVPDLLDALESDKRLTRSVHFWRDFARSRTVLGVREAVLTALMSILRVHFFEPTATGDNFTGRGEDVAREMAKRLRAYWKAYGHLTFDERMMKVITDPKTSFKAKREAAKNLATLTENHRLGTTVWTDSRRSSPDHKPNAAVAKFSKPTVAEAILAAMDVDLKAHDANRADDLHDYQRRKLEDAYLIPLIELGDKRIAAEVASRSQSASSGRMRRKWAYAAHWLGDLQPFLRFADDFRLGKVRLPVNNRPGTNDSDQPGNVELLGIIQDLVRIGTPEAENALMALANPKHPQNRLAAERVVKEQVSWSDSTPWFAHQYCLSILRAALDESTPTGATYVIEEGNLQRKTKEGWSGGEVPKYLADSAVRRDQAIERTCDVAATKLAEVVVGLPQYHPLFNNAESRLIAFRSAFDRFAGNYRRATSREQESLDLSSWTPVYLPDIRSLGRAATADDVKVGKAVFYLDGKGKPADIKLPAVAVLRRDEASPPRVLIVQAEVNLEGETIYGIIAPQDVRAARERELTGIKTFADLNKSDKEAAKE